MSSAELAVIAARFAGHSTIELPLLLPAPFFVLRFIYRKFLRRVSALSSIVNTVTSVYADDTK